MEEEINWTFKVIYCSNKENFHNNMYLITNDKMDEDKIGFGKGEIQKWKTVENEIFLFTQL